MHLHLHTNKKQNNVKQPQGRTKTINQNTSEDSVSPQRSMEANTTLCTHEMMKNSKTAKV